MKEMGFVKVNKFLPWYLSGWFITLSGILAGLSLWFLPFTVILLFMHIRKMKLIKIDVLTLNDLREKGFNETIDLTTYKLELESNIEQLKQKLNDYDEAVSLDTYITAKRKEYDEEKKKLEQLNKEITEITTKLEALKNEYVELDTEVLLQHHGFYEPKYNLEDSAAYKERLKVIRAKQKKMITDKVAATFSTEWTVNGSKTEGRKMTNNMVQLAISSFNNECDVSISKVTVTNFDSMKKKVDKSFERINKLNKSNKVALTPEYLKLKHEELQLALEYAQKIEAEKEEQREIREQMREEEKARREIAKLKEKVEKEEQHFLQALSNLEDLKQHADEKMLIELELKIAELQAKVKEVQIQKEDVLNRERNTRAGYVYIISNIGAFGENVYKIGMTRRLEPMDRVKELGDASVPFHFDVHALIFSEDAPNLESILHQTFNNRRVNMVNERKEFFNVTIDEIKKIVEDSHDKTVEFKMTATAEEYRETLALKKEKEKHEASAV